MGCRDEGGALEANCTEPKLRLFDKKGAIYGVRVMLQ